MDEISNIELAKKGDLFAFNELVLQYQQPVYNLCLRMVIDESSAEDIAQDTFISAFENINTFRGGSFKNWLLRLAANRCIDELRRIKRRPQVALEPISKDGDEMDDPAWLRDDRHDPAIEMERKELVDLIQRCMLELSDEHRLVLILVDVFEMDYQEASSVISKPLGTLKSRLTRARDAIKKCLLSLAELYPDLARYKRESV